MLASGILEKGDIIWSFDAGGPYGISGGNHVGIFWGDTPSEDRFWHTAEETSGPVYAGRKDGNRITKIQSLASSPSVWWVFKLSPYEKYQASDWYDKPKENADGAVASAGGGTATAAAGSATAFRGVGAVVPVTEIVKDIVFYGG